MTMLPRHYGSLEKPPVRLPTTQSTEPILAWKRSWLWVRRDPWTNELSVSFGPSGGRVSSRFGIDASMICLNGGQHATPEVGCSCGFYAWPTWATPEGDGAKLEVELTGRVIVHSAGYRAERQRILRVTLTQPKLCQHVVTQPHFYALYEPPCDRPAYLGHSVEGQVGWYCDHHRFGSLNADELRTAIDVPLDVVARPMSLAKKRDRTVSAVDRLDRVLNELDGEIAKSRRRRRVTVAVLGALIGAPFGHLILATIS